MSAVTRSQLIMWSVAAAALPAIAAQAYLYGGAVWTQLGVLVAFCALTESACLRLRGLPAAGAADGSAVVAACVLAVALPAHAPWFVAAWAAAAAMALGKHCYGGLGNNPFNPAMVGYALAFFAFPEHFASWTADVVDGADAVSSPTPLAAARLGGSAEGSVLPAVAAGAGGLALLAAKMADWRLVCAFALGAAATHGGGDGGGEWQALLHGGLVFAAFFVVTDPVTAPETPRGRWLYGFFVGALAVWLRQHGAHTDAIAFAILIGNMLAPLCDLVTKWRR